MSVSATAKINIVVMLGGLLALALYFPYLWFGVTPFGSDQEFSKADIQSLLADKDMPDFYAQSLPERTELEMSEMKAAYNWCRFCHTLDQEGHNRVGPNLYRIFGSPAAVVDHFPYSDSFIELRESGFVWTPDLMQAFIEDPHTMVPGNRMRYPPMILYDMCDKRNQMIVEYLLHMTAPGAPSDETISSLPEPQEGEQPFNPCV
jgi:cytochrome c2